jgi:hypothetical protein
MLRSDKELGAVEDCCEEAIFVDSCDWISLSKRKEKISELSKELKMYTSSG